MHQLNLPQTPDSSHRRVKSLHVSSNLRDAKSDQDGGEDLTGKDSPRQDDAEEEEEEEEVAVVEVPKVVLLEENKKDAQEAGKPRRRKKRNDNDMDTD